MNKSGNDNRRVRITERAMKNALASLLKEKPINKISVSELAGMADISRGTFYVHYVDIYDMVDRLEDQFVDQLKQTIADVGECNLEHLTVILENLFASFQEESDLFLTLLSGSTAYDFTEKIKAAIAPPIRSSMGRLLAEVDSPDPRIPDYFVTYIASSTIAVLTQWGRDGMPYDRDVMARVLAGAFTDTKFRLVEFAKSETC